MTQLDTALREKKVLTDYLRTATADIIDPIVTILSRWHISPDLLTVGGMVAHVAAAWLIIANQMAWAGGLLLLIAPLDALDGALARKSGQQSGGWGAFLDSTSDRIAEIILFGGFIIFYSQTGQWWLVFLAYLAATGSLMVSYARARAEALNFTSKIGVLSRVERYVVVISLLLLNLPMLALLILAILTYVTVVQRIATVWRQANNSA